MRIIVSLMLILLLEVSYVNSHYKLSKAENVEASTTATTIQSFEIRAFINSIEKTQLQLFLLNAKPNGEYEFRDYIYYPQDKDFDLNKEFVRLRLYQKTQWDQKAIELSHKVKSEPGLSGSLKMKKQFDTLEEANSFLTDFRLAFSYQRKGFEYQLGNVRIFLEDIQGLPPSIELVSASKQNIDQLFDELAPVRILSDSIPKLIQEAISNKRQQYGEPSLETALE